jgi:hypothetical protein
MQSEPGNAKEMRKRRGPFIQIFEDSEAQEFVEKLEHYRSRAKDAIKIGQGWMERGYNKGQTAENFCKGDLVLMEVHA